MGIGIFAVWPLAKKFGKKNITVAGFILYAVGSAICFIAPTNLYIVLVGQFIKNMGGLPCSYVFMALFADALDNLEWKNGFRCDGLAMSAYSVIITAAAGLVTGIFNGGIASGGNIEPFTATIETLAATLEQIKNLGLTLQIDPNLLKPTLDGIYTIAVNQNETINFIFILFFVGLEAIGGIVYALMLIPVNVEKTVNKKLVVIRERQKATTLAKGEVWIEPELKAEQEQILQDKLAEEAYLKELLEHCKKKNLNYELELQKHLDKLKLKEEKRLEKEKTAIEKNKNKEEIREAKLKIKYEKLTLLQKQKKEEKLKAKAIKDEEKWQIEKEKGEIYYMNMQKELAKYQEV